MRKQYHILNGDALKERFPSIIRGDIVVARECLVDGDVTGNTLEKFFHSRALFLSENYKGCTVEDYYNTTVSEFQKIHRIPDATDINLWFEDDLFCQVNFWFTCYLLSQSKNQNSVFLIRPEIHKEYGFGGLDELELVSLYKHRVLLTELDKLASLWKLYQKGDTEQLLRNAKGLASKFPFVILAVQAHAERLPSNKDLGRPSKSLIQIMKELNTEEFAPIFRAFCKRESIYGFGDAQVKRLLVEIKSSQS